MVITLCVIVYVTYSLYTSYQAYKGYNEGNALFPKWVREPTVIGALKYGFLYLPKFFGILTIGILVVAAGFSALCGIILSAWWIIENLP